MGECVCVKKKEAEFVCVYVRVCVSACVLGKSDHGVGRASFFTVCLL